MNFQSCTANSGGVCSNIGNAVTVHFNTLPLNNSATITIVARVNGVSQPGAAIVNTASLQTPTSDPNAANNSASNTVTVVAAQPGGDTDSDGMPNGWETQYGLDPTTGDGGGRSGCRRPHEPSGIPAGHAPARLRHHLLRGRRDGHRSSTR